MSVDVRLAEVERSRLVELEHVVERGLQTFVEVGQALMEIRDSRLYRESHGTFEAYCQERWGFTDRRARQLVEASVVGTMVPVENERQARELAPLADDEAAVIEAWREARAEVEEKHGKKLTAQVLHNAVRKRVARLGRDEEARRLREEAQARFGGSSGPITRWEEIVHRQTPREALLRDHERLVEGVERLRVEIGRVLPRQAADGCVELDWMPYVSILAALRGKKTATPRPRPAADALQEVDRYLFEHPEVARLVRAIDEALAEERGQFISDFFAWLSARAARIGETVAPLLDELAAVADDLPEVELESGRRYLGYTTPEQDERLAAGETS